jgi:transcriptional regulator with XRE-family HTH domain
MFAMAARADWCDCDAMDLRWLRDAIKRSGKSQKGLAEVLGVHPSQVGRILKGERILKAREVEKIEAYLGIPTPLPSLRRTRTRVEHSPLYGLRVMRIAAPGVWREDGAKVMLDRIVVPSSPDPVFSGTSQFAVLVEGTNRYAICAEYGNRQPQSGELVVVERRNPQKHVETTICRLQLTDSGWRATLDGQPEVIHRLDDVSIIGKVLGFYEPTT